MILMSASQRHPLREPLYTDVGPLIAPELLIRADPDAVLCPLQAASMEQMQYNLLFSWFVGLSIDNPVWAHGFHQEPRPATGDGHVAQGDGGNPS